MGHILHLLGHGFLAELHRHHLAGLVHQFGLLLRELLQLFRRLLTGLPLALLAHLLGDLPASALAALAETDVWADDGVYAIVAVTGDNRDSFLAALGKTKHLITIDDGDEFTIVIPESQLDDLPPLLARTFQAEYGYRFVHLEATLPWDTVGYGAAIFAALASAGLSAGFYSGYSIDYLLVRDTDLAVALAALEMLIEQTQRQPER